MKYLLLLLFLVAPAKASETLSALEADARLLVLDSTTTTRQRFSSAQVDNFINQGMRSAIMSDNCLQNSLSFQLIPGTTYYALPSNYENILRVTVGYKYIPQQSVAALDGKSRGWEVASGYPTYYYIDYSSRSLLGFAPWPQQSSDTDTVKVEYTVSPTDMVNGTDLPFNSVNELQVFDHYLAYYAGAIMATVDDLPERAKAYMDVYAAGVKQLNASCVASPAYLPSGVASP